MKKDKEKWERNLNRLIKSDSRERFEYLTPPVREAMHALDQIKAVHGRTPSETHPQLGFLADAIIAKRYGVEGNWNKNWEYRVFLKDSLLHEETAFHGEKVMSEDEWMAVEAYAIEDIGIKKDIVYKGNLFRKEYLGCSKRLGCVKREADGVLDIDNVCRQKCQNLAVEKTGFFTMNEIEKIRKINDTMV